MSPLTLIPIALDRHQFPPKLLLPTMCQEYPQVATAFGQFTTSKNLRGTIDA